PEEVPCKVVSTHAERSERDEQPFSIGRRGAGGVGMGWVMSLVRHRLPGRPLPPKLAGVTVKAKYFEAIKVRRRLRLDLAPRVRLRQLVRLRFAVGLHGGDDEYLVAPDDRRRASGARQLGLPRDIGLCVPLQRWVRTDRRRAIREWPSPARPLVVGRLHII